MARPSGGGVGDEIAAATGGNAAAAASSYQVAAELEEQDYTPTSAVSGSRGCCSRFIAAATKALFVVHLLAFATLVVFLAVEASSHQSPAYRPSAHFVPLASAVVVSTIAACFWLTLTVASPSNAIKVSLWAAPVLTLSCAVVVLLVGDGAALGLGLLIVVAAVAEALYGCWATTGRRLEHASAVLAASVKGARLPVAASCHAFMVLLAAFGYLSFWTVGISSVAAAEGYLMHIPAAYVAALLVSMAWTMQVLRYFVFVAVAKLAHTRLVYGLPLPGGAVEAFCGSLRGLALGDICVGAVAVPAVALARGFARGMNTVTSGNDEFLCSGQGCLAVSEKIVARANRWGLVDVGTRGTGFCVASRHVWTRFAARGMLQLVDGDFTGSFCFLAAVSAGAVASLLAGSWALATDMDHKELALPMIIYAFLIGYYMCRIMIAWPQACVAAYHVAYAENPRNPVFGTLIPQRLRELQEALAAD